VLAAAAALTGGVGALFYRKNIKELKELREVYDETLDEQEIEEMERMRLIAEMNFLRDEADSRTAELERQLKSSNDEVEASRQMAEAMAAALEAKGAKLKQAQEQAAKDAAKAAEQARGALAAAALAAKAKQENGNSSSKRVPGASADVPCFIDEETDYHALDDIRPSEKTKNNGAAKQPNWPQKELAKIPFDYEPTTSVEYTGVTHTPAATHAHLSTSYPDMNNGYMQPSPSSNYPSPNYAGNNSVMSPSNKMEPMDSPHPQYEQFGNAGQYSATYQTPNPGMPQPMFSPHQPVNGTQPAGMDMNNGWNSANNMSNGPSAPASIKATTTSVAPSHIKATTAAGQSARRQRRLTQAQDDDAFSKVYAQLNGSQWQQPQQ